MPKHSRKLIFPLFWVTKIAKGREFSLPLRLFYNQIDNQMIISTTPNLGHYPKFVIF
ncbi:hypothetical protein HMPREF3226_00971 [Prevotella corporis]|uniref:Uncharacterized protein n=1 Tax=Prevotella corporis TaxID=28128 RepID=A0A133QDB4_9BACT|nr:hypothetical protein HMPREF3226_00971 [Prevotella corporis]